MSDFEAAKAMVIGFEGGYADNPDDPGGATKWGVTQRTFTDWLGLHGFPDRPVVSMTDLEMTAIYRTEWERWSCDKLVQPWALVVMDAAINLRFGMSARLAQATLRYTAHPEIVVDGVIGTATIVAANANPALAVVALHARLGYHVARTSPVFVAGLINRLMKLEVEVDKAVKLLNT